MALWHYADRQFRDGMMAIHDIFSKRQKRLRGEVPDVYIYDIFPPTLKTQIIFILKDVLGQTTDYYGNRARSVYAEIIDILCREWGVHELYHRASNLHEHSQIFQALNIEQDPERCLDIVELCFVSANEEARSSNYAGKNNPDEHVDSCIADLNSRFREHGLGFEFVNNEIIRIDSQFIHAEVVKPAIHFLSCEGFEGPQEEFFDAHSCYRHGSYKDAINCALKSFESTMKVICDKRKWPYKKTDTAKKLITICMDKGLFPTYYQSHFSALTNLLEGGVPAIRNNEGGHGQGSTPKVVDLHIASYTLHMTASAIVLLVKSHEDLLG